MTDITERKKSEEYEKKVQEEMHLGQKLRALGRLSGGIAHEFNNILGIILGYAEVIMSEISEDNPLNEYLIEIVETCLRAKNIVKQILIFSQKDKGERKPLKISSVIKEGIELINPLLPSNIKVYKNFRANGSVISGDKTCIHQILINLCMNAIHSISWGSGAITVDLSDINLDEETTFLYGQLKPGPYVKLTVSDTGQGMDSNILKHIFEPYFTTKEIGKGVGMGLAVVHGIVKNHNGDIKVYSEKGKGATFDILFPRLTDKSCEEEKPEKEILPVNKSKRILFIDDEQTLVNIGKLSLNKMGYNVFATKSCGEALKIFSDEPFDFDLVITDQAMPEMSGLELIKKLRDIRADIPVILCTGHSEYINEENAHLRGIKKLMMKPFTSRDLMEGIQSVIN